MNVDWMGEALCHEAPELPWIAEPGDVSARAETAMRALCRGCPVVFDCLHFAHVASVSAGFWAGDFRDREQARDVGGAA